MAILFFANDAYNDGLGGKNLTVRWVLAVGMAIAVGLYLFYEGRLKKGESRDGGGGEGQMGTGAFGIALISLDFGDGSFGRHVVFGRVFAGGFGILVCAFFALRWRRRKEARECDGEGRPDKVVFAMGILALLLTGFNFAMGVYGSNFMLPCVFFGCLGVSMCLEYVLDTGREARRRARGG